MNTDSKIVPETSTTQSIKSVGPAKKKPGAASKASRHVKAPSKLTRSSRTPSNTEKLVCRYCASDDLAPSFLKRRDARCRACFKKRYSSTPRNKKTARGRKTKASN